VRGTFVAGGTNQERSDVKMKILMLAGALVTALAFTVSASAAIVPGVFDPGSTGCVEATFSKKTLHLEKNCPTVTNASAGAQITGVAGKTFTSASFTLANATQCQGGSPRFNVVTTAGLFFLGCNNVTPTTNPNGTATYTFTAQTLAAAGQQVPTPTGTVQFVSVLIDVQGTADLTKIRFNGKLQKVARGNADLTRPCKNGGWKNFTNPTFKNQGQCVKTMVHARNAAKKNS
jgi:hypothetical protein